MIALLEKEEKIEREDNILALHKLLESSFSKIGSRQSLNTNLGYYRDLMNKNHQDELKKFKKRLEGLKILQ